MESADKGPIDIYKCSKLFEQAEATNVARWTRNDYYEIVLGSAGLILGIVLYLRL
jgi:hypothetical protein